MKLFKQQKYLDIARITLYVPGTIESKKGSLAFLGNPEVEEDMATPEGSSSKITGLFKSTPQQKDAKRSRLQSELSEAEDSLGPLQEELEKFVAEAEEEVHLVYLTSFQF